MTYRRGYARGSRQTLCHLLQSDLSISRYWYSQESDTVWRMAAKSILLVLKVFSGKEELTFSAADLSPQRKHCITVMAKFDCQPDWILNRLVWWFK